VSRSDGRVATPVERPTDIGPGRTEGGRCVGSGTIPVCLPGPTRLTDGRRGGRKSLMTKRAELSGESREDFHRENVQRHDQLLYRNSELPHVLLRINRAGIVYRLRVLASQEQPGADFIESVLHGRSLDTGAASVHHRRSYDRARTVSTLAVVSARPPGGAWVDPQDGRHRHAADSSSCSSKTIQDAEPIRPFAGRGGATCRGHRAVSSWRQGDAPRLSVCR
jgi:hypothetical protein